MTNSSNESTNLKKTLDNEVKAFANGLQYWAKYLAEKNITGDNNQR